MCTYRALNSPVSNRVMSVSVRRWLVDSAGAYYVHKRAYNIDLTYNNKTVVVGVYRIEIKYEKKKLHMRGKKIIALRIKLKKSYKHDWKEKKRGFGIVYMYGWVYVWVYYNEMKQETMIINFDSVSVKYYRRPWVHTGACDVN